jgi:hypothetical protein
MEKSRSEPGGRGRRMTLLPSLVFGSLVVAAYAWMGDHRPHAVALLPYLLLLACPLMHLFHRHGHDHHGGGGHRLEKRP